MAESEIWRDPNGNLLKFQDGDYVRIDISSNPAQEYTLPFLEGYVRGYNLSGVNEVYRAAYELFRMGHNPLQFVREEVLSKASELVPHTCRGGVCGICGSGAISRGLSIFAGPKTGN